MVFKFLTKKSNISSSFFLVQKIPLNFVGIWPDESTRIVPRVILHMFLISLASLLEIGYAVQQRHDLVASLEGVGPALTMSVTLIKILALCKYRRELKRLLDELKRTLFCEQSEEVGGVLQNYSIISGIFALLIFSFANTTLLSYAARPIIANIISSVRGTNETLEMPLRLLLPELVFKYPVYPFAFATVWYTAIVTGYSFAGCDGAFIGFCCHLASGFRLIQFEIQSILADIKVGRPTEGDVNNCLNRLKGVVARHNDIIALCKDFSRMFAFITVAHFASASIVICISCFLLVVGSGVDLLLYTSYNLAVVTQLFVYCLGGNYLLESSQQIQEVVYFADWYKCDVRIRKMLLMIMIRANKPTGVEIPFFQPSLLLFGSMLSTSGSYIALLKTFI